MRLGFQVKLLARTLAFKTPLGVCLPFQTRMKINSISLLAAALLASAAILSAQETKPATNAAPRRTAAPPLVSPQLLPDGGVTFRLRASKANEVKVSGQFGADAPMTKDT